MESRRLYALIGSFLVGVAFQSFFDFGVAFAFTVLSVAVGLAAAAAFSVHRELLLPAVCIAVLSLGIMRMNFAGSAAEVIFPSGAVVLEGVVADEPDIRERRAKLVVSTSSAKERVLVTTDRYPEFSYGDFLRVSGKVTKPLSYEQDDGRVFDYAAYLAKEGIYYEMRYPSIELIDRGRGNFIKEKLLWLKNAVLGNVGRLVSEPQASLLGGLLVGAKRSLGEALLEDFRIVGLIHIVVLSGYNITIVAEFLMGIFSFLRRRLALSVGAISIVLFAIMTGGSATVVRASIMALLVILAKSTARTYRISRALFLAAFFMVLHNPKILVFDTSFQLSFMATLGLIYASPVIARYMKWIPGEKLREVATATVATQLFVLPLLLYKMGDVSLVALPVNLLVLLFVPATMLAGFLTGAAAFVSAALALPFAYVTHFLLTYVLLVTETFAKIPFASVHVSAFPVWIMWGAYVVLFVLFLRLRPEGQPAKNRL